MDLDPLLISSNPLSAFTLIRTLTTDTLLIERKLQKTIDAYSDRISQYTPKEEDLKVAVTGLSHIQETYNLRTEDLAKGVIQDKKYGDGLTAHDLFEIGKQLIQAKRFKRSIEYLKLALKKTIVEDEQEIKPTKILTKLVEAFARQGDIKTAVNTIDEAIYVEPNNSDLSDIKVNLIRLLTLGKFEREKEHTDNFDNALTRTTCNGKLHRSVKELSKLRCRLISRKGFSLIAPSKLEELHFDPKIIMFHDVVYEKEIRRLKKLSKPVLNQSVVSDTNDYNQVSYDIRISKVAWFADSKEKIVKKISKRIEHMTGLLVNSESAEKLQIQQYGIGGFYKSHHDAFEIDDEDAQNGGNRIATALLYVKP
jgi:prolyl 4-hydroxylase